VWKNGSAEGLKISFTILSFGPRFFKGVGVRYGRQCLDTCLSAPAL
jgi:hypothetical protein